MMPEKGAATNTLIDSIYQNSSMPVSIIPLVKSQLVNQKLFIEKEISIKVLIFHLHDSCP